MEKIDKIKKDMITYLMGDISTLSNQSEEKEAMAFLNKIRGQIGMMTFTSIISMDEAKELEDELGKARKNAEINIGSIL